MGKGASKRKALIVGLGISGLAAAKLLVKQDFQVAVSDVRSALELETTIAELNAIGISEIETSGHTEEFFDNRDLIVVSPGVPLTLPILVRVRELGVEIIGEVELAARFSDLEIIALTGTNGKTTTVSLLGEIFSAAGVNAFVGGNLGRPAVEMADVEYDLAILELSSFQLEAVTTLKPQIAVILNLTPDHQDRYADESAYLSAKRRICQAQESADLLVLNYDDEKLRAFGDEILAKRRSGERLPEVLFFSVQTAFSGFGAVWLDDRIAVKLKTLKGDVLEADFKVPAVKLPGQHNRANYLTAFMVGLIKGLDPASIFSSISQFPGIPHRLEMVGTRKGVDYYNDSKATNIDAVIKAVGSFDKPLLLLMGGYNKGADFSQLNDLLAGKLRRLIPFGAAAESIARQLPAYDDGFRAVNLEAAFNQAEMLAKPGDVVLLAPGCASFDEFDNYEKRGDYFRELVKNSGD